MSGVQRDINRYQIGNSASIQIAATSGTPAGLTFANLSRIVTLQSDPANVGNLVVGGVGTFSTGGVDGIVLTPGAIVVLYADKLSEIYAWNRGAVPNRLLLVYSI